MIFSELYGAYYAAVTEILKRAVNGTLDDRSMIEIIEKKAFGESVAEIQRPLKSGEWQLLLPDCSTPIKREPTMPLSLLEKRWLKTVSMDKRVKLFDVEVNLPDIKPLFNGNDIEIFDRYGDGDDYENAEYIKNFKIILQAVKEQRALQIDIPDKNGRLMRVRAIPERLEYSEKDDKFRLYVRGNAVKAVNLGKVISVKRYHGNNLRKSALKNHEECAVLEVNDGGNVLERCLFHFAHFKKQVEKVSENKYIAKIYYDVNDENEIVIRVLSFGANVKAVGGERLVNLIKERLKKQKKLWN